MKRILFLLAFACSLMGYSWERQSVWPKGKMPDAQEHQIAAMTNETGAEGFKPEKFRTAYLEWFEKPEKPNGCCMILISGGGYYNCCDVGLIKQWHERFTALGY